MSEIAKTMKPQDVVILLKITSLHEGNWTQADLAKSLEISQSEISESVGRMKFAGLMEPTGKRVMRMALMDFLIHGLRYVFPQQPGGMVTGIPTAHSAFPLSAEILSNEPYVWPFEGGNVRGLAIQPLYPSVPKAAMKDPELYEILALVDAVRVGRARERELAIRNLRNRLGHGKKDD